MNTLVGRLASLNEEERQYVLASAPKVIDALQSRILYWDHLEMDVPMFRIALPFDPDPNDLGMFLPKVFDLSARDCIGLLCLLYKGQPIPNFQTVKLKRGLSHTDI